MEIVINTDNFEPIAMSAHCPKCQKMVEAAILNEYDIYTEFCHSVPECGAEWSFASYEQCKILQNTKYQRLAYKINHEGEGRGTQNAAAIIMGFNAFIVVTLITGGGGIVLAPVLLAGRYTSNMVKKSMLEDAMHESYQIGEFFSKLRDHHLDNKFIKEAEQHLNNLKKQETSRPSLGISF